MFIDYQYENVTPEKGDINKFVQEMPNYEDPNIREGNSEDYKKKKPNPY